jgi:multiple sugar transport system substrate-binding protein
MKKLTYLLVVMALLLSACAPAATPTAAPVEPTSAPAQAQPTTAPAQPEPTKAPAEPTAAQPVSEEPVTLEFWQHDSGGKITAMEAVIEGFNKIYPNITINQTVVPYDDYQTKIAASVPAGTGADIAMSYFGWIPLWSKQGFIVPLPDAVAKEVNDNFVPFAQVTNIDGKQYSVLTSVRNFALFYNKTLLEAAGVTELPTTWDEFVANAQKCTKTDANGNITQAGYFMGWEEDGWNFYRPLIESFGGQWGSADGTETLFNKTDEAKAAWNWLLDLTEVYKVSTPSFFADGESAAFAAGLTCYSLGLTFSVGFFQESMVPGMEWGITTVPAGPAGTFTTGSSWPLVLTSQAASDPAKLDAATKFLAYMATEEAQTLYTDLTKELPSRTDMIGDAKYTEDPLLKPFIDGLPQTNGPFLADELAQRQCAFDMYNMVLKNGEDRIVALDAGAACDQAIRDAFFGQ